MKRKAKTTVVAVCLAMAVFVSAVQGGLPAPVIDEAAYVNLDYYGKVKEISVVKSVALNGNTEIKDYGSYQSVINMTNYDEPKLNEEGVSFSVTQPEKRFYYQCMLKEETLALPWTVDVGYKLNGVPKKAEELFGASGLVEITITADANLDAKEYYKNNMLLQVAAMVDTQDVVSIEAPGAQLQAMGTYKAVIFAALPGESKTFRIRIGTEDFSFDGITMLMIPGTLEQLKDIKELKESKEKVEDAADDIYDSLDSLLETMKTMSNGLAETKEGLAGLQEARAGISSAKAELHQYAGEALGSLGQLAQEINGLVPHLEQGQQLAQDLNHNVNSIVSETEKLKPYLTDLQDALRDVMEDLTQVRTSLDSANDKADSRRELFERLQRDLERVSSGFNGVKNNSKTLGESAADLNETTRDLRTIADNVEVINGVIGGIVENTAPELDGALQVVDGQLGAIGQTTGTMLRDMAHLISLLGATSSSVKTVTEEGQQLMETLSELSVLSDEYIRLLEDSHENTDDILAQGQEILSIAADTADTAGELIDRVTQVNETVNVYYPDALALLENSQTLTEAMRDSLTDSLILLNATEREIRINGEKIDAGTEKMLNGLMDVLDQSISGIGDTEILKKANTTIKDTVDKELDRFTEDTNVLNMDYELPAVSLTSEKNPSPESIQIILRTEEITEDEEVDNSEDLEKSGEKLGLLDKIKLVCKKIWNSIQNLFHKA